MFIVCHQLALPEVRSSAFSSIFEQLAKTVFGAEHTARCGANPVKGPCTLIGTDEETAAEPKSYHDIGEDDRYPFSLRRSHLRRRCMHHRDRRAARKAGR